MKLPTTLPEPTPVESMDAFVEAMWTGDNRFAARALGRWLLDNPQELTYVSALYGLGDDNDAEWKLLMDRWARKLEIAPPEKWWGICPMVSGAAIVEVGKVRRAAPDA